MIRMLALTTLNNSSALKKAVDELCATYGPICEIRKIYFKDYEPPDVSLEAISAEISRSDIVLVDVRSDCRLGRNLPHLLKHSTKIIVVLVGATPETFSLTRMGKFRGDMMFKPGTDRAFSIDAFIKAKKFSKLTKLLGGILPVGVLKDMRLWVIAQEYYNEGGPENLKNLLLMLLKKYGGIKKIGTVPPPHPFPSYILYHPDGTLFTDLIPYRKAMGFDPLLPTVGVLFHSGMHFDDGTPVAQDLYRHLQGKTNLIFLFSHIEHNMEALKGCFSNIDLFVNAQYFRLWGGPYGGRTDIIYEYLTKTDVPLLTGLRAFETELAAWEISEQGINPIEAVLGVVLPELDGAVGPYFLAGLESRQDETLGVVKTPTAVPERVELFSKRILRWLALRKKPNRHKKIAILTYNYPPGEDNLASAGYLDVFQSLTVFLDALKADAYHLERPEDLKKFFIAGGIVNNPAYLKEGGIRLPAEQYAAWFSELPERIRNEIIQYWGDPPGEIMVEDGSLILPAAILGNVLVGVQPTRGVHEAAENVYHDKGLPPHHQYLAYYLYLERVFGADAVVHFGMHGTLEFTKGKEVALSQECYPDLLIGGMPHIYYYWIGNTSEATIAKRRSYALCISHASPPMQASGLYEKYLVIEELLNEYDQDPAPTVRDMLREVAQELHLPADIPSLRKEIYRMKHRLMPAGLHVMNRRYTQEELCDYLLGVLRIDREVPSMLKAVARHQGLEWEQIKETRAAGTVQEQTRSTLGDLLGGNPPPWLDHAYVDYVRQVVAALNQSHESNGLLQALRGRYILPARGGDPIRDPEVYPSGRAMYAFDPRLIPTVGAEMRGRIAGRQLIEFYRRKHGTFPETVGFVLWGFETMKTGGDTIATILSLMGVRIRHKKSLWVKELDIVPHKELGHPRIDVLVTMCGIFRDTFGTHIDLLNRALKMVAELDEPLQDNFVKKHCLEMPGHDPAAGPARLFGPSPAEYATPLPNLIETSAWDKEEDLARAFRESMSYAYLGGQAQKDTEAFSRLLSSVDLITQERDNMEYDITDLDHYYEFLGGLSKAVQEEKGAQAEVTLIDQTENESEIETLKVAIERGTRSRTLNPRWIEGMLKHDFHGAKKIKDRVEYLLGFASTTGMVENWVFDAVSDRLVFDNALRHKIQQNNPFAARKIAEVLIETANRGYWKPDQERFTRLRDLLSEMEGYVE